MLPSVGIIILNYNNAAATLGCLESLVRLDYPNFEIVVVDNASTDASWNELNTWNLTPRAPAVTLLQSGANRGYAGGNNTGIRWAFERKFSYVWILNNDTQVTADSLQALIRKAESHPKIGMVGSLLVYDHNPGQIQCAGGGFFHWAPPSTSHCRSPQIMQRPNALSYINGAAILAKAEMIRDIGLLDERFFLYWEDVDWSLRARRAGWTITGEPAARIRHQEGSTAGRQTPLTSYHHARSGVLFLLKNYPLLSPALILIFAGAKILSRITPGRLSTLSWVLRGLLRRPCPGLAGSQ